MLGRYASRYRETLMNESLLDKVESDEVVDSVSPEELMVIYFLIDCYFDLSDQRLNKSFSDGLDNILKKPMNSGYVIKRSDLKIKDGYYERTKLSFNVTVASNELDEFNDLFGRVAGLVNAYEKDCIRDTKISVWSSLCDLSKNDDQMVTLHIITGDPGTKTTSRYVSVEWCDFYMKQFGDESLIHSLVPYLIKYRVLEPMDRHNSRFCLYFVAESMMYVYDKNGREITFIGQPKEYLNSEYISWKYDENDLMKVRDQDLGFNYWDLACQPIMSEYANYCGEFSEGFCRVRINSVDWNYINTKGQFITDKMFIHCEDFSNGVGKVECKHGKLNLNGKWNLIDNTGNLLSKTEFNDISRLSNSDYAIVRLMGVQGNLYNLFNYKSGLVYNGADGWFSNCYTIINGYAKVKRGKKFNYLKEDGTFLLTNWYDDVIGYPDSGVCAVQENYSWRFIDVRTEEPLNDMRFSDCAANNCLNGSDRFYIVKERMRPMLDERWNCTNVNGELISKKEWFKHISFLCNRHIVCQNEFEVDGKSVIMNKIMDLSGKVILDYDKVNYDMDESGLIKIVDIDAKQKCTYVDVDGKPMFGGKKWANNALVYIPDGFFLSRERNYKNIISYEGENFLPKYNDDNMLEVKVIEPNEYIIVEDMSFRYNVFNKHGKQSFKKWTYSRIEKYDDGILRVGNSLLTDYDGNIISVI